ncbi:MAG TPA: ABC transporter permease [Caulobacteraceae bacterium]|nr:ABC transporter permease [Caulobacteraceae bacterium]
MSQAFDAGRWWPAPLLPREDGRQASLLFVLTALCFLACLAVVAALAAGRAAEGWRDQLIGSATVVVRASPTESADAAQAHAVEALAGVKGVAEARGIEKEKAEALVARFLGPDPLPPDLPVPRLVAVELDRKAPAAAADLTRALKAAGVDASVDDHSLWTADIMRAGRLALGVAAGLFLVIAAALGALIAFATRQGLAARGEVVAVLHLSGGTDAFIARQFQARFARMAAQGGVFGAALACLAAAGLKLYGQGQTLAVLLPVRWSDLAATLPCPLAAALVAAVTARLTAEAALRRLP